MSDFPQSADIAIIGGGIMGASTAYHLALRHAGRIVLLEQQPLFGAGATGKCAGGVRYQFSTEINVRLSLASLPMIERFSAETGGNADYRPIGYLFLLTREADVAAFERNVAMQRKLGAGTEWLDPAAVRKKVPQVESADVLAATFNSADGLADPHGLVYGYINAARRLGVQALTDTPVTGVRHTGDHFILQTPHGELHAGQLVNATGPWAAPISAWLDLPVPVVPVRRQIVTTTAIPDLAPDLPFVIDFARSLYFHPEGDGILTGMSNPHEPPGFDERVDLAWEEVHLDAAIARLPLLAHAGLRANWAGLYEVTPDAHPIIGGVPGLPGYWLLTGFSGHGFMHGPICGLLLAEMITTGHATTLDISALDLARFSENRLIREYNVV
jgi:sarcosine oxidase subunit beta